MVKHFQHFLFLLFSHFFICALVIVVTHFLIIPTIFIEAHLITDFGLKTEILLMMTSGSILLLFSQRFWLSTLLVVILYLCFIILNIEKIKYLNSPILPMDIKYLKQLVLTWNIFLPYLFYTLITLGGMAWGIRFIKKRESVIPFLSDINRLQFTAIFIGTFVSLTVFSGLYKDLLKFSTNWKARSHLVTTSEKYGFMTAFVRNLIHASESNKPIGYNKQTIESILSNLKADPITSSGSTDRINLIVYLVESFIDPSDFNIKTTSDPIPFFHQLQAAHQSGYVYSPEYGGRSANAEFELLTGFTIHFFQPYVIPFIDLPYRKIPSIAHELKNKNYHTQVIQAASLGYFNYQQMYEMLGFDEILSLDGDESIALDIAGRYPSDFAVVDQIIKISAVSEPYFIYAFPNSTHGAWNYDHYLNSDLDISQKPLSSKKGERHLKTYINALNRADQAIQKLIEHFEQQKQKTVILILGDHQPGIPELLEQQMFQKFPERFTEGRRKKMAKQFIHFDENNPLISYDIMHKVPYVIWTNFSHGFQQQTETKGMNELVIKLFNHINHNPVSPFYQFLAEFIKQTSHKDILKYSQIPSNDLSPAVKKWILSYQQLQYDLLLGENYTNNFNN